MGGDLSHTAAAPSRLGRGETRGRRTFRARGHDGGCAAALARAGSAQGRIHRPGVTAVGLALVLALGTFAAPAAAQDITFSPAQTGACLTSAQDYAGKLACVGASAVACMEATPGGYSTYGESACVSAELEWWDDKLNRTYIDGRQRAKELDREAMQSVQEITIADALRDMQRAWIGFRDAKCTFARSHWQGGTGGGPATAWCLLYETAEQTLYLQSGGPGQ